MAMPRLTLFGRSLLLIVAELLVNAACWIVAGILFSKETWGQGIVGLAFLAWVRSKHVQLVVYRMAHLLGQTIGLRHGVSP
jgi:hypothetical protein